MSNAAIRNFNFNHTQPMPNGGEADKTKKNKWRLVDRPGEFAWLPKGDLKIDLSYQRDNMSAMKVRGIAQSWSWLALGTITVCLRGGAYWVVDGQHRVAASMERSDVPQLPCMIFESEDNVQEAQGFLRANTFRKPLTSIDRFNAMVTAGEKSAQDVQALLQLHGYEVSMNNDGHRKIKCVGAMLGRAREDFATLEVVFGLCVASARDGTIYERVLDGLFHIERALRVKDDSLANQPWKARVLAAGQKAMKEGAERSVAFFGKGGSKVHATGILEVLNRKCRNRLTLTDE